jgi:hypothetical protein
MRWAGYVAHVGEKAACKILVGNIEGRPRQNNIKIYFI